VSWDPSGIYVGDRFREYVERLRRSYPLDTDLARKYGLPAGNGCFQTQMNQISGSYGGDA